MVLNRTDIIVIVSVAILLVVLISIAMTIKSSGSKCMENPQQYLIEILEKSNHADIICYCLSDKPATEPHVFGSINKNTDKEESEIQHKL